VVTSGTFSPTLRTGIGLALVDAAVAVGDEVSVGRPRPTGAHEGGQPSFVDSSPR
jgi:aminomethyltransferase